MHELSIAICLIEQACEAANSEGAERVTNLNLRIGELAGVVVDSLRFSFELAAEETICAGAELSIEHVPLIAYCPNCEQGVTLRDAYRFVCPRCESPTPRILSGQELELVSLEIVADETASA